MAWALAGTDMVESKTVYDQESKCFKKVRQCHLGDSLRYHWFVESKGNQFGSGSRGCLEWLVAKDLATRAQAKKMFKDGHPWGEALSLAVNGPCFLDWQLATDSRGNTRRVKEEQEDETRTQSKRKAQDVAEGGDNAKKKKCPDFNSAKGCVKKERNCPHKLVHRCSKCNHFNHGAHVCSRKR